MRTSHPQYAIMVEFMEKHGDLSKPSGGPRGRHFIQQKWKELTDMLNSDGTGDSRTEEKWRKVCLVKFFGPFKEIDFHFTQVEITCMYFMLVLGILLFLLVWCLFMLIKVWSDFKNNVKKKWAKINRSAQGTGGGPALQLSLTDLENRVMNIIGVQAATGMPIQEAGFIQVGGREEENLSGGYLQVPTTASVDELIVDEFQIECTPIPEDTWNTPGTSNQPTVAPPPPAAQPLAPTAAPVDTQWQPPKKKKKAEDHILKIFKECEGTAREYERERDRIAEELERERIRQRDVELQL